MNVAGKNERFGWRTLAFALAVVAYVVGMRWAALLVEDPLPDDAKKDLLKLQLVSDPALSATHEQLSTALLYDTLSTATVGGFLTWILWKEVAAFDVPGWLRRLVHSLRFAAIGGLLAGLFANAFLWTVDDLATFQGGSILWALTWTKWTALTVAAIAGLYALWHRVGRRERHPIDDSNEEPDASRREPEIRGEPLGVCFSGGGIRSAGFSLGALEALEKSHLLQRMRWIAAVSGGNYAATGWTLSKHRRISNMVLLPHRTAARDVMDRLLGRDPFEAAAADIDIGSWSATTKQEQSEGDNVRLRAHGLHRFLMNGPGDLNRATIWAVLAVLFNLVLLSAVIFTWARLGGMLLSSSGLHPDITAKGLEGITIEEHHWKPAVVLLAALGAILIGAAFLPRITRVPLLRRIPFPHRVSIYSIYGLGGLIAFLTFATIVGPWLMREIGGVFIDDSGERPWSVAVGGVSLSVLAGAVYRFFREPLKKAAPRLGGVVLLVLVMLIFGKAVHDAARGTGLFASWFWWFIVPAVVYALAAFGPFDTQCISIRELYRNRLTNSFAPGPGGFEKRGHSHLIYETYRPSSWVRRLADATRFGPKNAGPATCGSSWDDINHPELPELVVCCAASRRGLASTGVRAESFTISPTSVRHYGDGDPVVRPTSSYVKRLSGTSLIPLQGPAGWMATSGAAFASGMGRISLGSTQALLAAFNVDLGIWLPSIRRHYAHPTPVALAELVTEIFGIYSQESMHTFVSDGGHFDNLGLAEMLQRCEADWSKGAEGTDGTQAKFPNILCFDASNDDSGTFQALRDSLAVADVALSSRLRFDIDALPTPEEGPWFETAVYPIPFRRFEDPPTGPKLGTIYFAKLQHARDLPSNIRRYLNTNIGAPKVSTRNQLLTDEHFLYLLLAGYDAGCRVIELIDEHEKQQPTINSNYV